jgi:hypothetical protein
VEIKVGQKTICMIQQSIAQYLVQQLVQAAEMKEQDIR